MSRLLSGYQDEAEMRHLIRELHEANDALREERNRAQYWWKKWEKLNKEIRELKARCVCAALAGEADDSHL